MSSLVTPQSPKHGYSFDGQDRDVRRSRKERRCTGAFTGRGGGLGTHAADCTGTIQPGDICIAGIVDLFAAERYCCLPCALALGIVRPEDES